MGNRYELEGKLDLAGSERLALWLGDNRGGDVTIDAAGVTQIGAHAAQTLLVAAATWAGDGHALTLDGVSPTLDDQLSLMGLSAPQLQAPGDNA